MAELKIEGHELVLHLTHLEEVEAIHGDLRVPLAAVRSIEVLEDAHKPADHGFREGERIPGVSEVSTVPADGRRIFAAVHHDTPRGIRIVLDGTTYDEWIVGCADPDVVKIQVEQRK
jgi:hypothetical protein